MSPFNEVLPSREAVQNPSNLLYPSLTGISSLLTDFGEEAKKQAWCLVWIGAFAGNEIKFHTKHERFLWFGRGASVGKCREALQ